MQKLDAVKVSVGSLVAINRNGKVYQGKVLRAPTFKDGDFRPTQFKVEVLNGDEAWCSGNHYVMYSAVHTAEADKAQAQRAKTEAEAKAQKVAQKSGNLTKGLNISELAQLAQALKTLSDLGFDIEQIKM